MKFDTSIILATLAAAAVAAPAPYDGVARRYVDTTGNKLPAEYAASVRRMVSEKANNKRQLDQLLGGLLGGKGNAGGAGAGAGGAGGLGALLGGAGGAGGAGAGNAAAGNAAAGNAAANGKAKGAAGAVSLFRCMKFISRLIFKGCCRWWCKCWCSQGSGQGSCWRRYWSCKFVSLHGLYQSTDIKRVLSLVVQMLVQPRVRPRELLAPVLEL